MQSIMPANRQDEKVKREPYSAFQENYLLPSETMMCTDFNARKYSSTYSTWLRLDTRLPCISSSLINNTLETMMTVIG